MAVGSLLNGYLEELCDALFLDFLERADSSWHEGTLEELAEVKYGKDHKKLADGPYPVYGSGGFMRSAEKSLFSGESVLIPRKGSLNNVMYVDEAFWTVDTMFFTVPRIPGAAKFLYQYVKRLDLASMNSGSAVPSMTTSILNALSLPVPPRDSLLSFNAKLQSMYDTVRANDLENRRLRSLRDSLLPKLMSGEIDASQVNLTQLNSHLLHYVQRVVHTVAIVLDERSSVETVINAVLSEMQSLLDPHQLKHLAIALRRALGPEQAEPGQDLLALFLTAKEVEGCSPKTIAYYEATLQHMNTTLAKPYTQVESDDLRRYLNDYEVNRGSSKVTIDNIRRIMSSFFSWLEDEDYIVKSPVRRIRRVKTAQVAKEVLSDEDLEVLRDACESKRDLAIVDLLASTGMRIGELVRLDRKDVNLHERECLVMGKGNKQRPVYFDARAKLHLTEYLSSRVDKSPALFVALDSSARRITVGSIELRLRDLGRSTGINRVHPHKFRRTLATHAIDKGMPIEQVQKLLGHAKIDTTMHYAMVNQNNVKASHRKYLE